MRRRGSRLLSGSCSVPRCLPSGDVIQISFPCTVVYRFPFRIERRVKPFDPERPVRLMTSIVPGRACFSLPRNLRMVVRSLDYLSTPEMTEYRRHLPHFHPEGRYLFVTWRLSGSLPAAAPHAMYATPGHAFAAEDRALARIPEPVWLQDRRIARHVEETICAGETEHRLYELQAWVVMPNHVHVLLLPHAALREITQWIKGRTAREANRLLGRTGQSFWQHESYDHWVRNEKEFNRIVRYIEANPVSAGLSRNPEDWPWSSAGRAS